MLAAILSWIGKIIAEVAKDVLKSPAKEIEITEVRGAVDLDPTPVSNLRDEYRV